MNSNFNFDEKLIKRLYKMASTGENDAFGVFGRDEIKPIKGREISELSKEEIEKSLEIGEKAVKNGEFAVITMAGGQGSRLGFDGPKGAFYLEIEGENHTLFEIQAIRISESEKKYNTVIPWYIMTSEENNDETVSFFEKNNYFGLKKENVFFFVQCMLPMVRHDGEIVYDMPGHVKMGADGHGGIFKAVLVSGAFEDMEKRGIKWIYIGGIDNILAKLCDPLFIGYTQMCGCTLGSKTLIKRNPQEKVGVFCTVNGRVHVIEYSELPEKEAELTDENGELLFADAHILCNLFNISIFKQMADEEEGLPYHVADKNVKVTDEKENVTEYKAYKFERFIFDAFKYIGKAALLRVKREDEFAPIKNKDGEDSPESATKMYIEYNKRMKG